MKKIFMISMAALALAACAPEYDTDKLPVIPEEINYSGEGSLLSRADGSATSHTYTYSITEEGVEITASVSLSAAGDNWVVGYFTLSSEVVKSVLGDVDLSDIKVFYPVNKDGSKPGDWTTYKPGEWVDADGNATNWSDGHVYWFWQAFANYEEFESKDALCIGHNPSNAKEGEKIVSKSILNGLPFNVTISIVK